MRTVFLPALPILVGLSCGCVAAQEQQVRPPAVAGPEVTDPARMAGDKVDPAKPPLIPAPVDSGYEIGPEDVITVWVFQQPSMSGTYPVRTDGMVSVPLIGQIKAGGMTVAQVEGEVVDKLKTGQIVIDPNVTVNVLQVNSKKIYISGEGINRTCEMPLVVPTHVSQALAYAGGFKEWANIKKIRIVRQGKDGKVQVFHYNDKQVSHGQHLEQNIVLQPGDHIYVDG
jgi:polysaccharide biosynthesis/export protein